jgi:hypothetical protein
VGGVPAELKAQLPAGAKAYQYPDDKPSYYAKFPDGGWKVWTGSSLQPLGATTALVKMFDEKLAGGTLLLAYETQAGGAEYAKGAKIPAGWKIYYKNGAYAAKSPDGNWYLANVDGTFMSDIPAPKGGVVHDSMEKGVASGDAKKMRFVNGKLAVQ